MATLYAEMMFLSSMRIVRVTLALAVGFWMAGGGCMLGCESMVSAASAHAAMSHTADPANTGNAASVVVTGDACASMHSHDCCAKRNARSSAKTATPPAARATPMTRLAGEPTAARADRATAKATTQVPVLVTRVVAELDAPWSTMMDCPLAVNATAALPKAKPDAPRGDLLLTRAAASLTSLQEQLTTLSPPSLLPNRGHTYLHCCVFLI